MLEQTIDIDGCEIRYADTGGSGPTVLFLHGIGASLEFWHPQLEACAGKVRAIAVDLPGHGLSGFGNQPYDPPKFAAFLWQFVDKLGLGPLFLVGNSMGGGTAIRMAQIRPQQVNGMLLAAPATVGRKAPMPFRLMTLPLIGELMNRPGKMAVEQMLTAIFFQKSAVEPIRPFVVRNDGRPGVKKAFLATLRLMTDLGGQAPRLIEEAFKALRELQMPIVFVHGREDVVIPFEQSQAAAAASPNSQMLIFEECGHTPQLEKPEAFNAELFKLVGV